MTAALEGVAVNPAAPVDVLLRLLEPEYEAVRSPLCTDRREFPEEVVDAIAGHPELRVRAAFTQNPHIDGEQHGRLVDDPEWIIRAKLAGLAGSFADAEDPLVRLPATFDPGLSPAVADRLTRDQDRSVRAAAARHPRLPPDRLLALLDDDELAACAAANPTLPVPVMRRLLG
ncbi:hypothetical protein [Streptomyces lunaelactis]|uniref:hypothetical protein n=1 Tax=Streptomyces lunaelactis TaxID=1535768 RepID=UPI0020C7F0AF|nr:hypothetical protein [Streptomyces lunaelactis]